MIYTVALSLVAILYVFICALFWANAATALGIAATVVAVPFIVSAAILYGIAGYTWLRTRFSNTGAPAAA